MGGQEMREITLQDIPFSTVQTALQKAARIVDPMSGIIKAIMPNWLETGDAEVFAYGAVAGQAAPLTLMPRFLFSGGASLDKDQSIAAAIGEGVERYSAAYVDRDCLVYGSYDELSEDAIHPIDFNLYSKSQYDTEGFPFQPFTTKSKLSWTWGFSIQHKKPVLVPASLTYLPLYVDDVEREARITATTSTGLACGNTLEEAILSAMGEVVERDSLVCFWLNRMPVTRIIVDEGSGIFESYTTRLSKPGLEYQICEVTTDLGIPTVFTLLTGNSTDGPMVNAGSQANLSPTRATLKSLVEAAQGRPYIRFIIKSNPGWEYKPDFSTVNSFQDHAAFYTRAPQHRDALDFIGEPITVKNLSEIPDLSTGSPRGDIEIYLKLLAKRGLDVVVVDMTSPDIEDVGLKVVRVLIPGLQLLHGDHRYPHLGGKRIYGMRQALGFGEGVVTERDLNPYPHPLP
jgi:ribosomal protein S12 methylthiotransferase accessory factor